MAKNKNTKEPSKHIWLRIKQKLVKFVVLCLDLDIEPVAIALTCKFIFNYSFFDSLLIGYSSFIVFNHMINKARGYKR